MGQLLAVITCWHPQCRYQSVSWYTQTVVAQNMIESSCRRLDACVSHVSLGNSCRHLLLEASYHRFKDVPDACEVFISFNLHMYIWQNDTLVAQECYLCAPGSQTCKSLPSTMSPSDSTNSNFGLCLRQTWTACASFCGTSSYRWTLPSVPLVSCAT